MTASLTSSFFGRRYQLLKRLGAGSMGAVYLALDRLTGQQVALKRVTTTPDMPNYDPLRTDSNVDLRLSLAQEFKTLASLRHPNIISVLDYGFDEHNQPYFTMELLTQGKDLLEVGKAASFETQLRLIVQMLQALAYLHRRSVIHRDLKPSNVFVVQENGTANHIKVLDFGISELKAHLATSNELVGTLAYMAPEVLLGEPASEATDLYAVGLMMCELIANRHPFETEFGTISVHDIVKQSGPVTLPALMPEALVPLVQRLLSRERADRFASAGDVIEALEVLYPTLISEETVAIRDSFLQAAHFVGRQNELVRLTETLAESIAGRGQFWLVGGESGVGKSRLLDELRTFALVHGVLVLKGQAIANGSSPYYVWREVLRLLALYTDPDPLEAGVLKTLVPDIDRLLDRPVETATTIDPQAAQQRLFNVVEQLLRRLQQPTLLLLEDLHWAGDESLTMLQALSRSVNELPLLIIANYRDDEAPELPRKFEQAQQMKLQRLSEREMIHLSEAMLGEAGRQQVVVDLLKRETEGNVFFVIEVVRALAEEAGQLDRIGKVTLPHRVFAGGIEQIIRRRLERVPEVNRPLLRAAAVIGRQLDLRLLGVLSPTTRISQWLADGADAAVLEIRDAEWRFAHDKLRDGLLKDLSEDETRQLHAQVATGLETLYANDPQQTVTLAYHWAQARNDAKEAFYSARAGKQALQNGLFQEAIGALERAAQLADKAGFTAFERAVIDRQLGEAYYGLGDLDRSRAKLSSASKRLHFPVPEKGLRLTLLGLGHVLRQFAHRALPSLLIGRAKDRARLLEANRIGMLQAEIAFFNNDAPMMMASAFRAFNMAEAAGASPELARTYANLCFSVSTSPLKFWAETYKTLALQTARDIHDTTAEDYAIRRITIYDVGLGRWEESEQALRRSADLITGHGNPFAYEEMLNMVGAKTFFHCEYERSKGVYLDEYESTLKTGNLLHRSWGLLGQGQNALKLGQLNEAGLYLQASLDVLLENKISDVVTLIQLYGMLAAVALRQAKLTTAQTWAAKAMPYIQGSAPNVFALLEGYTGAMEVFLNNLESDDPQNPELRAETLRQAEIVCKLLKQLGTYIPITKPRALVLEGRLDAVNGKQAHALANWQAAADAAAALDIAYDAGLAAFWRAKYSAGETRQAALKTAATALKKVGAAYELSLVENLKAEPVRKNPNHSPAAGSS